MPLYPPASTALEPFGPDLVTGDNQYFTASLGDWIETGTGALTWLDTGAPLGAFHPINTVSTHVLHFEPAATNDYIELTVAGTFVVDVPYIATLCVIENNADSANWALNFGDVATANYAADVCKFYAGVFANAHFVSVVWTPTSTFTSPKIRFIYEGAGLPAIDVGYCKVAEVRDYPLFRSLDITENENSWMRFQGPHFTIVNEDFLVEAVDLIRMNSGEEITMTVADGDVSLNASQVNLIATAANVNMSADNGIININGPLIGMYGAEGLATGDRPTTSAATDLATAVTLVNQIRTALLALGVVLAP